MPLFLFYSGFFSISLPLFAASSHVHTSSARCFDTLNFRFIYCFRKIEMETCADTNEVLVEAVRTHRCLCDIVSKVYRDWLKKEQAWISVSSLLKAKWPDMDEEPEIMEKVWDYFVKEKKKLEQRSHSEAEGGAPITSSGSLFTVMEFLRDTVTRRVTLSKLSL